MRDLPDGSGIELDADIDAALARLHQAFPGICIWHGEFSGSLWALLPDRLVEAKNAAGLARRLHAALGPPRSVPPTTARRRDGTWTAPRREAVHNRRPGLLARLAAACRRLAHGVGPARQAA
ncbi:hypothetical protein BJF79_25330 [Actinomadura sp. CNU-125]|nr:hypothetical protein BJF79_25330 [Actinomadura sp. CNU-125]